MPKNHVKFHSTNGKRRILIADDELINREILRSILEEDYELIFAADGKEALDLIGENQEMLSLVLLDILMPGMTGLEVLKAAKEDQKTAKIPIIVVTSERESEILSLQLGASDFFPKPYPDMGVVRARVQRAIELSEDREIIQSTERDTLTGLYNREYFYKYVEQYDQFHREAPTDAIYIDINHFHLLNERYGRAYGDEILKRTATALRNKMQDAGGIVCRRNADSFMIYCPEIASHKDFLAAVREDATEGLDDRGRVRYRMGVYPEADKELDSERRFDRAKMASDTVRGSLTVNIGFYDDALHKREIYAEQLIEDFPAAIREHQFVVLYQPKFDVRPDTPILAGAEALVRWNHPTLGMISPGVFIPLFEENGLILQLDTYIWEEAARQIRQWQDQLHYKVPVSVNVSRVDMFDPQIVETFRRILDANGLSSQDLHLEVTESAYTQDSEQIINVVQRFRDLGFRIEMDDFGTGYSSLNMISSLPIDVLKLDMHFVRNAFRESGSTRLLEIIIDIADYLSVPVIAEGVETEKQMDVLKAMGCDMIQGYFFSKPVPPEEFEPFILQRLATSMAEAEKKRIQSTQYGRHHVMTPIDSDQAEEKRAAEALAAEIERGPNEPSGLNLRKTNIFSVILAFIVAAALAVTDVAVTRGYERMERASSRYIEAQLAASALESGSDYLTDRVRCFVVTEDITYMNEFFTEVNETRRRDQAVEDLESLLEGNNSGALESLNAALDISNELVKTEYKSMRLVLESVRYSEEKMPEELQSVTLTPAEEALSPEEKLERARQMVFDDNYMHVKDRIRENVRLCTQELFRSESDALDEASRNMATLTRVQTFLTILLLLIVLCIVIIIATTIRKPLTKMVERMRNQEQIPPTGAEELRFVTRIYNVILKENKEARERLSHEASHDALTGLFNRGAYEMLLESVDKNHMALILVDVDYFKTVNDTYGHAVGDKVLKRVAEILQKSFRSVDIICRIGGDEFAVVMTRSNSSMRQLVLNKINQANDLLMHPKDGLPAVSLSVGVAFSDRENPKGDIFADADEALYRVKQAGHNGCAFFE